jgi:anti-sigma regulatory factor (Ser/Thr protein kinase)
LRGSLPDDVAVLAINFANVARWKFSSNDALAGREARHAFRRALGERGLPLDDLLGAELIFGELLSNAARHAGGEVQFALDWREGEPILHMIDRGPGYRLDKNVPDVLAERGRGLWLIECMGGKLEVEPLPGYGSHTRVLVSNARELLSA